MNSKPIDYTEDKVAFEFFSDIEDSCQNVNEVIEDIKERIKKINGLKAYEDTENIYSDLPNLAVTLNNKLVEYYQTLKEKGIKLFGKSEKGESQIYFAPYTVIYVLCAETQYVLDKTLNDGFIARHESMDEEKNSNWDKIEGNDSGILRVIRKRIWDLRSALSGSATSELFYSEDEITELREYLEQYFAFDLMLDQYDIFKELDELIITYFGSVQLADEQKESLVNNEIRNFLRALGKEEMFEKIRDGVIKSNEKEKKNSWQLDPKEKAKIQAETAKIGKNSKTNSQARTTKLSDCERTK